MIVDATNCVFYRFKNNQVSLFNQVTANGIGNL